MKIDDQLESVLTSPLHSVLKVRKLALYVWLTRANFKGPVPNRQSHMVQSVACRRVNYGMYACRTKRVPGSSDICKIILRNPGVPVVL